MVVCQLALLKPKLCCYEAAQLLFAEPKSAIVLKIQTSIFAHEKWIVFLNSLMFTLLVYSRPQTWYFELETAQTVLPHFRLSCLKLLSLNLIYYLTCFSSFFFRLQILSFSCLRQESCTRHGDWHRPIWAQGTIHILRKHF